MKKNYILRVSLKPLIPFIMIFGLYVQFHGDFGPGGGFQAGVIFAAAIILYTLIYGLRQANQVFTARRLEILVASGVLLYGSVGLASMALGGNFLDYNVLIRDVEETAASPEATGNAETAGSAATHETSPPGSTHGVPSQSAHAAEVSSHDSVAHGAANEHHAPAGQHLGILLIELGVGLTVATVFVGLFFLFVARSAGGPRHSESAAVALEEAA